MFPSGIWREVRYDIDPGVFPDVEGDITDLHTIPDASVDAVYSSHTFEHVHEMAAMRCASEMFRVLRPTGFVVTVIPNFLVAAEWIARGDGHDPLYYSPAGSIRPWDIMFGGQMLVGQGMKWMEHKFGYTPTSVGLVFRRAGFEDVRVATRGENDAEIVCLAFVKEKQGGKDLG